MEPWLRSPLRLNVGAGERAEDLVESCAGLAAAKLGGCFVDHQTTLRDDNHAGAERLDFFQDVGGENDRLLRGERLDEGANLVFLIRVETIRGFVEDESGRI